MGNCILTKSSRVGMDLLWTNSNPTSSFLPQEINLDLSDYKLILIEVRRYFSAASTPTFALCFGFVDGNHYPFMVSESDSSPSPVFRDCIISTTSISFGSGYLLNNSAVANDYAIPYRVYGICGIK